MDQAKAAAKRAKWYRKIARAYEEELLKQPSAPEILERLAQTSDLDEISFLLTKTVSVGHRMLEIDVKKEWPLELDVGSVYGSWQRDWAMEAIGALQRAINKRDGTAFDDPQFHRLIDRRLEAFAGNEAVLDGKTNIFHYLRKADPEQTVAFLQYALAFKNS